MTTTLKHEDVVHIFESNESVVRLSKQYQITTDLVIDIRLHKKYQNITKNLIPGFIQLGKVGGPKLERVVAEYIIASTDSYKYLADHLGVELRTVFDVRSGRTWKHLDRSKKAYATGKRCRYINRPHAKINVEQLPEILKKLTTHRNIEIAKELGISPGSVSAIRRGVSWKAVTRPKNLKTCCTEKGAEHHNRKLTPEEIKLIVRSKESVKNLAIRYNVDKSTIYRAKTQFGAPKGKNHEHKNAEAV